VSARLHTEELDVNGATEARIEEHVPAGMTVVVIDTETVAISFPVAAARNVVGKRSFRIRLRQEHAKATAGTLQVRLFS
jgi:hypothetical protein